MQFFLRLTLFALNLELTRHAEQSEILSSFLIGSRFDLRMAAYAALPLILLPIIRSKLYESFSRLWLSVFALGYLFFGFVEFEFYGEFQQRLNQLVFQYLSEDPTTVLAMLWQGMPVMRYLLLFSAMGFLILSGIKWLYQRGLHRGKPQRSNLLISILCVSAMFVASVAFARGTLRTGPPLRWGDAYVTNHLFLNHLGLNGSFTLITAGLGEMDNETDDKWLELDTEVAETRAKHMLFLASDRNTATMQRPISRMSNDQRSIKAVPKNVIIILMESFAAAHVGIMGGKLNVTPEFDALTQDGILFERFFSNGTHTHQGMFATLSSFPNLPGHEYLMQQPEGRNQFSGFANLLPGYQRLFVYNGDFSWDNQQGFFSNQGFETFVGRNDYINPIHEDAVWGVSDEDMFLRGLVELDRLDRDKPFVAVLQSLSNHLPYSLPEPLSMNPVMEDGVMNERLTAMKYSDYALGKFMAELKQRPYFDDTLVVIVGDHGFGTERQLTEVNLLRFHVPMLLISPFLDEHAGNIEKTVGSQVDIVPTILALLGKNVNHQSWGRNLFGLRPGDQGFAVIKPSGNDPTVAMIRGDKIITYDTASSSRLYTYQLGPLAQATPDTNVFLQGDMEKSLRSYVQTALLGLETDRMGAD